MLDLEGSDAETLPGRSRHAPEHAPATPPTQSEACSRALPRARGVRAVIGKEQLLMPPGGIFYGTAQGGSLEIERNEPTEPMTWRLGLLTDNDQHVHLGAVLVGPGGERCKYVDLLSAVGAAGTAELDLTRVLVLGRPQDASELRGIAERCIENDRLRYQLVELTERAEWRG
jgi:hypothetical protein